MRKNLFSYQNYRQYIQDLIEDEGFTYREFVGKYSKKDVPLTLMTLTRILSKNPKGEHHHTIRDGIWSELLKNFKLKKAEIEYLTLLKIFNDSSVKYPVNHPFLRALKGSLAKLKTVDKNLSKFSADSLLIAETYDNLHEVYKYRLFNETYRQVEFCMQGMPEYAVEYGLNKLRGRINLSLSKIKGGPL